MSSPPNLPVEQPSGAVLPSWWRAAIWGGLLAKVVLERPYALGLQPYLFFDSGWALNTDALLRDGLVPTQDFAFFYGLLTLLIDRVWFAVFGATAEAQAALSLVCACVSAQAVIRFAAAVRLRSAARWLLLLASPFAIMPGFYPTPTHALEHALLISALSFQAGGKNGIALLLATICMFVKPTLAAVYGPMLILVTVFGEDGSSASFVGRLRTMLPAAAAGAGIAVLLVVRFGIGPLVATLVPVDAAKLYAAENYGFFFGTGRQFWQTPASYLTMPAAFWMVGTVLLTVGAARVVRQARERASAFILTCAVLHLAFTCLLFGNDMSWKYYPYPLVFGLCRLVDRRVEGATTRSDPHLGMAIALSLLVVLGQSVQWLVGLAMLANELSVPLPVHSPATAGLLAAQPDQRAWQRVRDLAARDKVLILAPVSAGHVLMPDLDSPRSWFLLRPIVKPAELERLKVQIRNANWLVLPSGPGDKLTTWPELAAELSAFRLVEDHGSFMLAQRTTRP